MVTLLFTLVTPVIATESLTQDDFFVDVNADGAGLRINYGKGNNKRELVIWSFYEFDDENEDHSFQDTELIEAMYKFGSDYVYRRGRHEPATNIDVEYLWYQYEWNDGTKLELKMFIRPPNLEIEIRIMKYNMKQPWNDLTIIYEVNNKGKDATFPYGEKQVTITEKLNPNFIDQLLESLPF